MPLQQVVCAGNNNIFKTCEGDVQLFYECIKVKKVFDEFGLRDCIEGIVFELASAPVGDIIQSTLILRNCRLCDVSINDVSKRNSSGELEIKRLRYSGKCCCQVYGKDEAGNIIRMKPIYIPDNSKFSIGSDDTLCISFNIRRTYDEPNSISDEDFERLLHFLEEGRFELQCMTEAIIDENNNIVGNDCKLITNLGAFLVIKFDTEVQLCVPVLGYCFVEEIEQPEEDFCEEFNDDIEFPFPDFNPPQLIDVYPDDLF